MTESWHSLPKIEVTSKASSSSLVNGRPRHPSKKGRKLDFSLMLSVKKVPIIADPSCGCPFFSHFTLTPGISNRM